YLRLRAEETIDALEDADPRSRSQFVALYEDVRPPAETASGPGFSRPRSSRWRTRSGSTCHVTSREFAPSRSWSWGWALSPLPASRWCARGPIGGACVGRVHLATGSG